MAEKNILGKKALDKNNIKLGKIIRIEQLAGKTVKIEKPYAIIQINRFLQKSIHIPLDTNKILNVNTEYVIFNISKDEFDKEVEKIKILKEQQELYDGNVQLIDPMQPGAWTSSKFNRQPGIRQKKRE